MSENVENQVTSTPEIATVAISTHVSRNDDNNAFIKRLPPRIIRSYPDDIAIENMPLVPARKLNDSLIANICDEIRHMFKDGDRKGRKMFDAKLKAGMELQNIAVRINFCYSIGFDSAGILHIRIMQNAVGKKPVILHTDLKRLPMGEHEIAYFQSLFVMKCSSEIQANLDQIYTEAILNNTKPNYYPSGIPEELVSGL